MISQTSSKSSNGQNNCTTWSSQEEKKTKTLLSRKNCFQKTQIRWCLSLSTARQRKVLKHRSISFSPTRYVIVRKSRVPSFKLAAPSQSLTSMNPLLRSSSIKQPNQSKFSKSRSTTRSRVNSPSRTRC